MMERMRRQRPFLDSLLREAKPLKRQVLLEHANKDQINLVSKDDFVPHLVAMDLCPGSSSYAKGYSLMASHLMAEQLWFKDLLREELLRNYRAFVP